MDRLLTLTSIASEDPAALKAALAEAPDGLVLRLYAARPGTKGLGPTAHAVTRAEVERRVRDAIRRALPGMLSWLSGRILAAIMRMLDDMDARANDVAPRPPMW